MEYLRTADASVESKGIIHHFFGAGTYSTLYFNGRSVDLSVMEAERWGTLTVQDENAENSFLVIKETMIPAWLNLFFIDKMGPKQVMYEFHLKRGTKVTHKSRE